MSSPNLSLMKKMLVREREAPASSSSRQDCGGRAAAAPMGNVWHLHHHHWELKDAPRLAHKDSLGSLLGTYTAFLLRQSLRGSSVLWKGQACHVTYKMPRELQDTRTIPHSAD